MVRTGRRGEGAIEPTLGLLQMDESLLGIVIEQKHQGRRNLLLGLGLAIALEAVPIIGFNREPLGQNLGQFLGAMVGQFFGHRGHKGHGFMEMATGKSGYGDPRFPKVLGILWRKSSYTFDVIMADTSPPKPPSPSSQSWDSLNAQLADLALQLEAVQARLAQVQHSETRRQELQGQRADLETRQSQSPTGIKTELQLIAEELEKVELELESRLWNWHRYREPFWEIVRFGGAGVVLGWFLKTWAGG